MKTTMLLALTAGLTGAASAQLFQSVDRRDFGVIPTDFSNLDGARSVAGDTVNVAVTGFTPTTGALLYGPGLHTVGGSSALASAAAALFADGTVSSTVTTVGDLRTVTVSIRGGGASQAIGTAGLTLAGASLTSLFFEVPDLNGGPDLFNDSEKISAAAGTFVLRGAANAALFTTGAIVDDFGTSFSLGNGVTIGNTGNILSFGIIGADYTISYRVPAPGVAGVMALGGIVAARRRRA